MVSFQQRSPWFYLGHQLDERYQGRHPGECRAGGWRSIDIGDSVVTNCDFCLVPGTRQIAAKSIQDRVISDTNATATSYKSYVEQGGGNSRRIVVVPIVTGVCGTFGSGGYDAGCPPSPAGPVFGANTVIGFASFFLLPASN